MPIFLSHSGLSSFLNNQTTVNTTSSGLDLDPSQDPTHNTLASPNTDPLPPAPTVVRGSTPQRPVTLQASQIPNTVETRDLQKEAKESKGEPDISVGSTLDSKIDGFLQGNLGLRGLNMGFPPVLPWSKAVDSPSMSTENLEGTPVRDESGATPTQDEVMDEPAVQPFLYQNRPLQTVSTTAASAVVSGQPMPTYTNDSWQKQNRHALQYGPGSQHDGDLYQRDFTVKQDFTNSRRPQHVESLLPSSMADKNVKSNKNNETLDRSNLAAQFSKTGAGNASVTNDGWFHDAHGHVQERCSGGSSESYKGNQHQSEEHRHDANPPNFFNTPLPPLPPIPQLPPPPQDFVPPMVGGVKNPTELMNIANKIQPGGDVLTYHTNPVSHDDYDERLLNRIPAKETFHPQLNAPGPRHSAVAPHPVRLGPQGGPVDFTHRPRVPVHNQHHPGMPRPNTPSAVRGYHETPSHSCVPSEDANWDPHCDAPPHSPSPPPYSVEHPVSPHTRTFYPDERPLPLRHPEPRLRPRLELRAPPPHHYRPPRPGLFPPQRPLRRPPPPPIPHPSEPAFQRGKRHGPPFGGPSRPVGPFYPPKRPFLPPRY